MWLKGFGGQAYSADVLSGVFRPQNVLDAQGAGVFIYWEHDLEPLAMYLRAILGLVVFDPMAPSGELVLARLRDLTWFRDRRNPVSRSQGSGAW